MRHDIDPNEYLLDTLDYQSVIVINGCTATLIAPRWLLTAAHCTYPNLHYGIAKDGTIGLLDETLVVKSVHNHPDFTLGNTPKHDIALVEFANLIRKNLRPTDTAVRLGGDEFAVLIRGSMDDRIAKLMLERLDKQMAAPINLRNGMSIEISASTGIAFYPHDAASLEAILHAADERMYVNKRENKASSRSPEPLAV